MITGQRIIIRAYPNKKVERVVLREYPTYVLVCRPEMFDVAVQAGENFQSTMGFPKEDVIETLTPAS